MLPSILPSKRNAFLRDWAQIAGTATVFNDLEAAFDEAMKVRMERPDIAGLDALHIAAAYLTDRDELITTESKNKPMFRTRYISVVHVAKA